MYKSQVIPATGPETGATAPGRGDVVEFELRGGKAATGTVISACVPASGKLQLTIAAAAGGRYTRRASGVRLIRKGSPSAAKPGHGPPGQQPGQPAPNSGKRYGAEPLTPAEVMRVIGQCSRRAPTGIRNRALLTLLYRSGLRVSEVLALRPSDVNLEQQEIRLLSTKSGQPQTRGFHESAVDALARWLDTRRQLGLRNGRLFCTLSGGPVSSEYVREVLRRLGERADIAKRVHPHGLRHTFAVEQLRAGQPIEVISKLLGHSSIAVTVRYLDHLTNHEAIAALKAIELPALEEA